MSKKKAGNGSIQAMEFSFSPILSIYVASVSLLNLSKFVQYLKCLDDLSFLHQQDGLKGASSEYQFGVEINGEKLITKPTKEYLSKTKFEDSEDIAL